MRRKLLLMITLCIIASSGVVNALTLELTPSTQNLLPGEDVYFDLNVEGLTAGGPDSLGSFALDISYDSSIFSLSSVEFGTFLGDIDWFEADGYFDNFIPGNVYIDEVSFLFDYELDAIQGDSFTLATLQFSSNATGTSSFEIVNPVLSDAYGFVLPVDSILNSIVTVAPVPEPATMLLLGTGLVGLLGGKIRRKKRR